MHPPPAVSLILQYNTIYSRITSKGRYMEHVQKNIDIFNIEFLSMFNGSLKKYYNVLWRLSVATVGLYWRLLWSTAVCHF